MSPLNGYVYAAAANGNNIVVINPASSPTTVTPTTPLSGNIAAITYAANSGDIYASEYNNSLIAVIDPTTNAVLTTIPATATSMVYDPQNGDIYISNGAVNGLQIIDPMTNAVIGSVSLPGYPVGLAYGNGDIFVSTGSMSEVVVVNGQSNTVAFQSAQYGMTMSGIAYANGDVYIAAYSGTTAAAVYIMNATTYGYLGSVTLATNASPQYFAYDGSNNILYVYDGTGGIDEINVTTNALGPGLSTYGTGYGGITYDPLDNTLYAANNNVNCVEGVDVATSSLNTFVQCGFATGAVSYDPLDNTLYAANNSTNTVSVIQLPSGTPITGSTSTSYTAATPYSPTYFQVQASYDGWTSPWSAAASS